MSFLSVLGQAMEYDYGQYQVNDQGLQVSEATAATAVIGMMVFALIGALIGYVINSFLLSRIFKKAGVEQWKAWVPIYNVWIMLELGNQKGCDGPSFPRAFCKHCSRGILFHRLLPHWPKVWQRGSIRSSRHISSNRMAGMACLR